MAGIKSSEGFQVNMNNVNLKEGIGFVNKFTQVFRKIRSIDFGDNKLQHDQVEELGKTLMSNKYI